MNGRFGNVETLFENKNVATQEYKKELADKRAVNMKDVNPMDASLLASIGDTVSPIFKPLGFGNWKATVATVTGLVAKEEVVGTFGILYNYDDKDGDLEENGDQIWGRVAKDYTAASGMAFMVFNLLCAPCFAAIGAIKREMNNAKWTWAAISWMTVWAYVLGMITYNLGALITGELSFGIGTVVSIVLTAGIIYLLVRKGYKAEDAPKTLSSVEAAGTK